MRNSVLIRTDRQKKSAVLSCASQLKNYLFRPWNGIELPLMPRIETQFVDVVFLVDGFEFFCHKPIFSTRSEYFRALLTDHFDECQTDGQYDMPVVQIQHVSPQGIIRSVSL